MASHIDPVCGHPVDEKDAAGSAEQNAVTFYFDSEECLTKFNLTPEKYAKHGQSLEFFNSTVKEPIKVT